MTPSDRTAWFTRWHWDPRRAPEGLDFLPGQGQSWAWQAWQHGMALFVWPVWPLWVFDTEVRQKNTLLLGRRKNSYNILRQWDVPLPCLLPKRTHCREVLGLWSPGTRGWHIMHLGLYVEVEGTVSVSKDSRVKKHIEFLWILHLRVPQAAPNKKEHVKFGVMWQALEAERPWSPWRLRQRSFDPSNLSSRWAHSMQCCLPRCNGLRPSTWTGTKRRCGGHSAAWRLAWERWVLDVHMLVNPMLETWVTTRRSW